MQKRFTAIEFRDLIASWAILSLAVVFLFDQASFVQRFWIAALTVGIGFIIHELAHKFTAQYYGKYAEFRANYPMLAGSLLIAYVAQILIAAPGAVVISGFVNQKQNGIIAAAGPISNVVLALIALPIMMLTSGIIQVVASYTIIVNAFLAVFNLLPFGIFDGAKIISWSKPAYFLLAISSVLILFIGGLILPL